MPKQTSFTRSMNKAHGSLLRSFNLAIERHAQAPLGHDIIDPRTIERRKEALAMVGRMVTQNPTLPMDSKGVQQKDFKKPNHPQPKDEGQTLKNKQGGKVVDPTAIETAQSADPISIDTAAAMGNEGSPFNAY